MVEINRRLKDLNTLCTPSQASKAIETILACYPQAKAHDAKLYIKQLTVLLIEYPATVVVELAHPAGGIAGRTKFLPAIAEVKHLADQFRADKGATVADLKRTLRKVEEDQAEKGKKWITPDQWEAFRKSLGKRITIG